MKALRRTAALAVGALVLAGVGAKASDAAPLLFRFISGSCCAAAFDVPSGPTPPPRPPPQVEMR